MAEKVAEITGSGEPCATGLAQILPGYFTGRVHSPILQLQRMLGNQRVAQLIQAKRLTPQGKIIGLQPKLTVAADDDRSSGKRTVLPVR